jgi:hypothetical protein
MIMTQDEDTTTEKKNSNSNTHTLHTILLFGIFATMIMNFYLLTGKTKQVERLVNLPKEDSVVEVIGQLDFSDSYGINGHTDYLINDGGTLKMMSSVEWEKTCLSFKPRFLNKIWREDGKGYYYTMVNPSSFKKIGYNTPTGEAPPKD